MGSSSLLVLLLRIPSAIKTIIRNGIGTTRGREKDDDFDDNEEEESERTTLRRIRGEGARANIEEGRRF